MLSSKASRMKSVWFHWHWLILTFSIFDSISHDDAIASRNDERLLLNGTFSEQQDQHLGAFCGEYYGVTGQYGTFTNGKAEYITWYNFIIKNNTLNDIVIYNYFINPQSNKFHLYNYNERLYSYIDKRTKNGLISEMNCINNCLKPKTMNNTIIRCNKSINITFLILSNVHITTQNFIKRINSITEPITGPITLSITISNAPAIAAQIALINDQYNQHQWTKYSYN